MAFTRKFLSALGIEADKIDEIINAHTEVTDALKSERDRYKEDAEKLPGVQAELDRLKEGKDDDSSYKAKYEKEHADFEKFKSEQADKEAKANKTAKYRDLLRQAGVSDKRLDAVLKVSDIDGIELGEDGEVRNSDDLIKSIKDEWSEFIVKEGAKGTDTGNPPASGGTKLSKDEIYKTDEKGRFVMDAQARQAALAELASSEE